MIEFVSIEIGVPGFTPRTLKVKGEDLELGKTYRFKNFYPKVVWATVYIFGRDGKGEAHLNPVASP